MRPLSRATPVGPIQAYKTFSVSAPLATHWRPATCEEIDCEPYLNGWVSVISPVHEDIIRLIRGGRRPFTEEFNGEAYLFTFAAGTPCFKARTHLIQARPEIYVARAGDHRGNPTGWKRIHKNPTEFVEEFGEHQLKLIDEVKKG